MKPLLLATRSAHKAREIDEILGPIGLHVVTLSDLAVEAVAEEEDIEAYETFRANAVAKARYFAEKLGRTAIADDSGLRVNALGGAPGVRTKRFSGRLDLDGKPLDDANNALLLEKLTGVPDGERGARYVCCAAIAWPDGRAVAATGTVGGIIAREPRGEGGFGYDPLFEVPELGARFAEVPPERKNAMSHRARAFRALATTIAASPWPVV